MQTPFSRSTCYRMIENGTIYAERLGSRILIPYKELEQFLERCREGSRY